MAKIYTARVMSSSPHLGSPFELLIELLVAMGRDLTTRETLLLAGIWPLEKLNPRLDRFSTAEACNIAMGIFSSLCWEGVRFIPAGARIWHIGKAGLHILLKKEGSLEGFERKKFWGKNWGTKGKGLSGMGMIRLLHCDWAKIPSSKLLCQPAHSNNYQ